ncbi:HAD-IC family P-type ATPase [Thermaurantiacus sp.]
MTESTVPQRGLASAPEADADHALEAEVVLARLGSGRSGLAAGEAARRLAEAGPNRLPSAARPGALRRFLRQFHNLLIYVLVAAAVLAAAMGEVVDALVIAAVVVVNAIIGFVQEGRAEDAMAAIRAMVDPRASVLRDGRRVTIPAEAIVPGDVVLLEAGDRVPADLRLLKASGLRIDEAVLTGESVPVDKQVLPTAPGAPLGDRLSMAFSGSLVVAGQGMGVAVATGAATELGRVSTMLAGVTELKTPLLRQMNQFARQVTLVVLGVSVLVFALAVARGGIDIGHAFMVVVGLAVAAIPEGLPAVMTITLAVGVRRMAQRSAIIRRLPAVETLGSVSVICSDKTGTLTRNEMTATRLVTPFGALSVSGVGYAPEGGFTGRDGAPVDPAADPAVQAITRAGLLCNDADLRAADGRWVVDGDPMEGALVALAAKAGHDPGVTRASFPRLAEIPFDARHRYMATLHARPGLPPLLVVKGAPEVVIAMCSTQPAPAGPQPVEPGQWLADVDALAADGQRVIAIAERTLPDGTLTLSTADVAGGFTLLGLVGLFDPPRPEAIAAVADCRAAGIRVRMITGDHAATARAIAVALGLGQNPRTVTGADLEALDAAAFEAEARTAVVFARATPEQKLRLVEALQRDGSVVAMTGDGVNDAPALKRADIGIAMGQKGTEAAKEASDMVLADDNFASIVAAVREGRTVYDNLTKVIGWTLPTNGGEALTIIAAVLFGLALPIAPVQILWINMVTAVGLGLSLAFEPPEPGVMSRPPRPPGQPILSGRLLWRILFVSLLMVAGTFGVYTLAVTTGRSLEAARTLAVNAIVVMEIFYLFSVRYVHGSSLTWQGVLGTPAVLVAIASVAVAQLLFTYAPALQRVFGTEALPVADGLIVIGLGALLLLLVEAEKWVARQLCNRGAKAAHLRPA